MLFKHNLVSVYLLKKPINHIMPKTFYTQEGDTILVKTIANKYNTSLFAKALYITFIAMTLTWEYYLRLEIHNNQ